MNLTLEQLDTQPLLPVRDLVSRRIAGEHILVPVRQGVAQMDFIYTSNEVGSFVFGQLDGQRDGRAITRLVAEAFEVDEETAHSDVLSFLAALHQAGLAAVVILPGRDGTP